MEVTILAVIVLSTIIAVSSALGNFINKKSLSNGCDSFFYSFLGGLLGGFTGVAIGAISGHLFHLIFFSLYAYDSYNLEIESFFFGLIGLVIGVTVGGVATIKPVIKFLLDN